MANTTNDQEPDATKESRMTGTRWAYVAIFILLLVMMALALFPNSAASMTSGL